MSTLKEKLEAAKAEYNSRIEQYQNLQHMILVQQGAIQALEALIAEEEAASDEEATDASA